MDHYINGKGQSVQLGKVTQGAIINSEDQKYRLERITTGRTKSLSGNYSVDIESEVYHVGDTRVDYITKCSVNDCTTYFEINGDGFWDPIYDSDGIGPQGEFGSPFRYDPIVWEEKYPNPYPAVNQTTKP